MHAPAGLTIGVPTTVCCAKGVLPPGWVRNALILSYSPQQTRAVAPLRKTAPFHGPSPSCRVPSLVPVARHAMSNEGCSNPSRPPVSAREYGSTPRGRRSGPASTACSPMKAARLPTTPKGQVEFEPPGTEDARLETVAASEAQRGSFPQVERGEEGLSPHHGQGGPSSHGEWHEEGSLAHARQQQEGPVPRLTLQKPRRELEAQARLWKEHQRRQKRSQCSSRSGRGLPRYPPLHPAPRGPRCPCRRRRQSRKTQR